MICPLPEKFLTSFDMNRKFGGDLVSHPPGPGESEKWNQAEYQVRTCPPAPPPPAFEISDEQISGLRNRFCRPIWSGSTIKQQPRNFWVSSYSGAVEFIIPTCKVMHSNQHFLKSASSSLEGRGGKVRYFSPGELQTLWLVARINTYRVHWLPVSSCRLNKVRANTRGGWQECFMARRGPGEIVAF